MRVQGWGFRAELLSGFRVWVSGSHPDAGVSEPAKYVHRFVARPREKRGPVFVVVDSTFFVVQGTALRV